jgi:hypothetical protein
MDDGFWDLGYGNDDVWNETTGSGTYGSWGFHSIVWRSYLLCTSFQKLNLSEVV